MHKLQNFISQKLSFLNKIFSESFYIHILLAQQIWALLLYCGNNSFKLSKYKALNGSKIRVLVSVTINFNNLKVHKIEIFFAFDFEICIISLF
jgi:hypothetical protein